MNLLALDTSSNACSVALQVGDQVLERHVVEPREHTRILMPMITDLLDKGNIALADLAGIVLGNGPGSFIGMRIGASVAQGLCFGAGLDIIPVSSLAAVAAGVLDAATADRVMVAQDARMNQVYLGCYERGEGGAVTLVGEEEIVDADADLDISAPVVAAGAGWTRYPGLAEAHSRMIERFDGADYPRARWLLPSGAAILQKGQAIRPELLVPAYLRSKVAQKIAERN